MSTSTLRSAVRTVAAVAAGALSLSVLAIGQAHADTATSGTGTATVSDLVAIGSTIHIEGTGWTNTGDGGSTIAIKLDSGSTEPASGPVTNPFNGTSTAGLGLWAAVSADNSGAFSADITFPTSANTSPAIADSAWAVGTTHHLRLLTGVMETGDPARSVQLNFTVAPTLAATGSSASTGQVTVAVSGGSYAPGDVLSVSEGATALQWSSGRPAVLSNTITVGSTGSFSANVIYPAGTKRSGKLTLTVTGTGSPARNVTTTVNPYVGFSNGTKQGGSGTLTISNLPSAAVIDTVTLGDTQLASGLSANSAGLITAPYSIAGNATLGTLPLTITQSAPSAVSYATTQKVSPDETPFGTGGYRMISNGTGIFQGLYQSAFSTANHALYATAASGTGAAENGYLYKLDPETLAIEASVQPGFVTGDSGQRFAPYGVGVDDVNDTVWVTNTRTATVAVYDADDLSLLRQFPTNTITHPRDALYDPSTNRVFISSASEGTSGDGYISVFEGGDNDGDGASYEKIGDIATGPRTDFNPVSLTLGAGKIYSPSLSSAKIAVIDTNALTASFLTVDGINVGGRGGSGIAYDAANNHLFIASQNSDEVVIADATTGATIKEIPTGTQALNVAVDPVHSVAYVTNFGGTSVSVLNLAGDKIAALPITRANHVTVDGRGNAYVVDKNTANKVWKIAPTTGAVLGTALTTTPPQTLTQPVTVTVRYGETIHLSGAGFVHPNGTGSTLAVKLDGGSAMPVTGPVTNPVTGQPFNGVYAIAEADDLGTWSLDLPFPTAAALSDPSLAWSVGNTHTIRVLTGSLESGDTPRSVLLDVVVTSLGQVSAGTPVITGAAKVGQQVGVTPGTWADGATLSYQWNRNGSPIAGATGATYALAAADAKTSLTVSVTGSVPNYDDTAVTSAAVVVGLGTLTSTVPTITGKAKVAKTLAVKTGAWSAGTKLSYAWFANGKVIKGATKPSLKLTKAVKGKRITVAVTGTKAGYSTVVRTSKATGKVVG